MHGVAAVCGLSGLLALMAGLLMFLPMKKLKAYRKPAKRLSVIGASLFILGIVITPNTALPTDQRVATNTGKLRSVPAQPDDFHLDPIPRTPEHNYVDRSGSVYYYSGAALSDDDDIGDHSARAIHGFEYAGREIRPDNDTVFEVNSVGTPIHTLWCGNPCSVIHAEDGQMLSYEPTSIIGMVFQDIADGKLKSINLKPIQSPHAVGTSSIY